VHRKGAVVEEQEQVRSGRQQVVMSASCSRENLPCL